MDMPFTQRLEQVKSHPFNNEEAGDQYGGVVQEEQAQPRRGRRKRANRLSKKPVSFKLSLDLMERLGHYRVHRTRVEGRSVTNSEVAEKAVEEFLTKEGY